MYSFEFNRTFTDAELEEIKQKTDNAKIGDIINIHGIDIEIKERPIYRDSIGHVCHYCVLTAICSHLKCTNTERTDNKSIFFYDLNRFNKALRKYDV